MLGYNKCTILQVIQVRTQSRNGKRRTWPPCKPSGLDRPGYGIPTVPEPHKEEQAASPNEGI